MHFFRIGVLVAIVALVSNTAFAITSDFRVRTLIGEDTTPPSVPTNLVATPISMDQIDLAWDASTDDTGISGYQVFRDAIQIATTSNLTYVDTGLMASTTYTYYITAFDASSNFSASSSPVATTTYATPTPPVNQASGSQQGSIVHLGELTALEVIPSQYGVVIRYETSNFVRSIVRWGTGISYELGSSAERSYSKFHEIAINDLEPGTTYTFIIQGENHLGVFGTLTESRFTTLPLDDTTPPGNVLFFTATKVGDDVKLDWQNPRDTDFDHVRVLRSDTFFPSDEADGWLVYEGDGRTARDAGVAVPGTRLFYTIFTYDKNGNISSGAVVSVRIEGGGTTPVTVIDETKNEIKLNFDDISFYQDGVKIVPDQGAVLIDGGRHLTILLPYAKLPEHLKTILVTISAGTDQSKELNFLLRVNTERTAYSARLAPLGVAGNFAIRVSVFDFKTSQIGYTKGYISSIISTYTSEEKTAPFDSSRFAMITRILSRNYVWLFILFLLVLAYASRKLMHDEK